MTAETATTWTEIRRVTWDQPSPAHLGTTGGTDYFTSIVSRRTWPQDGSKYAGHAYERTMTWIGPRADMMHTVVGHTESYVAPAEVAGTAKPAMLGYLRKGEAVAPKTGRAARTRIGATTVRAHRAAIVASLIARINAGKVLVRDYLLAAGLPGEFVAKYESAFGGVAKRIYVEKTGQVPQRDGVALVRGWFRKCYAYQAGDVAILDAAARTYPRTAALIGA